MCRQNDFTSCINTIECCYCYFCRYSNIIFPFFPISVHCRKQVRSNADYEDSRTLCICFLHFFFLPSIFSDFLSSFQRVFPPNLSFLLLSFISSSFPSSFSFHLIVPSVRTRPLFAPPIFLPRSTRPRSSSAAPAPLQRAHTLCRPPRHQRRPQCRLLQRHVQYCSIHCKASGDEQVGFRVVLGLLLTRHNRPPRPRLHGPSTGRSPLPPITSVPFFFLLCLLLSFLSLPLLFFFFFCFYFYFSSFLLCFLV